MGTVRCQKLSLTTVLQPEVLKMNFGFQKSFSFGEKLKGSYRESSYTPPGFTLSEHLIRVHPVRRYEPKSRLYSMLFSSPDVFFLFGAPRCIWSSCLLWFFLTAAASQAFCVSEDLDRLKTYQLFCRIRLSWDLSSVHLRISLGLCALGKISPTQIKTPKPIHCIFSVSISSYNLTSSL